MRYRHLPNLIALFLACHTSAQNTVPPSTLHVPYISPDGFAIASDSADYRHFRQGLRWEQPIVDTDTTTAHYRQVWVEDLHGGFAMITRGDGSVMAHRADRIIGWSEVIPFRLADGRRGLAVAHETPCGLICRTTQFYLEE
ncbi:MAG TPA: hypothetical protein PLB89_06865 [Flavobacteriales bacterium]|nr:hypothetical protein [Flavobacteriales bacterium]